VSSLLPITTLVLWTGCLSIGGLGFALAYTRPQPLKPAAVATQAELLHVELTNDPLPPLEPQLSSAMTPPPLEPLPAPAAVPPLMAVAPVTAEVAFALPVEGPVRIVDAAHAAYASPTQQAVATAAPAPVQSLIYGVGDGRQPAPTYPREAVRAGQEGKVNVRFSVGENGRVLTAEAAGPSPWPLLNEEAIRTIRQRWRFPRGPLRLYEVTIRFELQKSRGES
jgi:TonB family protein